MQTVTLLLADNDRDLVEDRIFEDECIHIDGVRFERCDFYRCRLTFSIPDFEFVECDLMECTLTAAEAPRGDG